MKKQLFDIGMKEISLTVSEMCILVQEGWTALKKNLNKQTKPKTKNKKTQKKKEK
jgi:hypothetical protein